MEENILFKIYRKGQSEICAEDIPIFSSSELWGHLGNKFVFILQRLEYMNLILDSVHRDVATYNSKLQQRKHISAAVSIRPFIEIIHLMGDLRMILDELISLLYILEKKESTGDYPSRIKIDSIGKLLKEFEKEKSNKLLFFEPYKEFLEKINIVSNTYKHSFLNSDILFCKQLKKPTIYAGKCDYNNFEGERELIAIPLNEIVSEFNELFEKYRELINVKTRADNS